MRTQAEWKVITHMDLAWGPTSAATRPAISPAALLVNVIARISFGDTSRSASRYAIRWVSTRVLPEPAPATISSGPPAWTTAARCCGLRPSRRVVVTASRLGRGTVKRAVTSQPTDPEYHRYLQFFTTKCTGLASIAGLCAVS